MTRVDQGKRKKKSKRNQNCSKVLQVVSPIPCSLSDAFGRHLRKRALLVLASLLLVGEGLIVEVIARLAGISFVA